MQLTETVFPFFWYNGRGGDPDEGISGILG
jgi:hypothetical protein